MPTFYFLKVSTKFTKNNLSFPPPNRLLGIDVSFRLSQESPLAILHELREVEDTLDILLYLGRSVGIHKNWLSLSFWKRPEILEKSIEILDIGGQESRPGSTILVDILSSC